VIDGMSDDGARTVIEAFIKQSPWINLTESPKRKAATALYNVVKE
jgi:hypothetical protein